MERARGFLKKIIKIFKKPEMRILPGQLAFFLVLTIIPLAALLGALASRLAIPTKALEDIVSGVLPGGVIDLILEVVSPKAVNFNIAIFFISAFILASNGPHSMIITSNEIYKIESKNILKRRMKAIAMTLVIAGLMLVLFLIPICGDYIFEIIKHNVYNPKLIDSLYIMYQLIKYPVLIIIFYYNIKLLYVIAPDEPINSNTTTSGTIFTTIGWIISTEIFSFYIGTFTSYDKFYGSISNIIILLLWIYMLSYIFVFGMIINAGNEQLQSK